MNLRPLQPSDPQSLEAAFQAIGWSKPAALFERYLREQADGERWVRVAVVAGEVGGYVTVVWESGDPELKRRGIPEIMDLNVLPHHREQGTGTALMDAAEAEAAGHAPRVGLRVGLHSGYGHAQRLYVARGYLPDGRGASRGGEIVGEGAMVPLDDDTTITLILELGPT
ncbi:MAG: GNAT family N-acetyltransferase [Gemmatimonadetes bacterium]|nr:GNAT family N-acetyltransferase [Gemmatimonadota bacterium]